MKFRMKIYQEHTFVMINGVSKSFPPTNRIPHGVCFPSLSRITANSCNFGAILTQLKYLIHTQIPNEKKNY